MIKPFLKKLLMSRGIMLTQYLGQFDVLDPKLDFAKKRGLKINTVVDGGAAEGEFLGRIKAVYPDAAVLCIEPREDAHVSLKNHQRRFSNVHLAQVLIGPNEGTVPYNVSDTQSSVLPNSQGEKFGETKLAPMTTIDALVQKLGLPWPDLIKLDLQGFELEALRGAQECMKHAQALLLELSFLPLQKGMPLAGEVIAYVGERGFVIYDIPALWLRPLDGALAQGDFLFLKRDHPLRADARWSSSFA
jgi:FkbM family methyltransferase